MDLVIEHFMAIALFFSFIALIFYGYPVAWTMGGLAILFTVISMLSDEYFDTFFGVDWQFASMMVYRLYGVMANWVLVALPMFIFMGIMLDKSGIAEDLMTDLSKLFGRTRGGLAISIVFIGVLLAASTGIIGAAVVLLTILGVPLMLKNEYNPDLACGAALTCCDGLLYPTTCCDENCDESIDVCGDVNIGDVNGDGIFNVLDVVLMVNLALDGGYEYAADMNGDGIINVLDIVNLINAILG